MKPTTTYTGLLAVTLASTCWAFHAGNPAYGYTTLLLGTAALLSFSAATRMTVPFWADGIELPLPPTGSILSTAILIEAAGIFQIEARLTAGDFGAALPIITRGLGFLLQLSAIGKLARDFGTLEATRDNSPTRKSKSTP